MASGSEEPGPGPGQPRRLTDSDVAEAGASITGAFAWHEPWGAWALPDEATREQKLRGLIEGDLRSRFIPHGECWTIDNACVTLWIPPPGRAGAEAFSSRRLEEDFGVYGEQADAMRESDAMIAAMLPEPEHWYLDTIATDPARMRQGLGGRLLDHDLAIRDDQRQACALDAHTRDNVGFYGRRGFEVVAEDELAGNGPHIYMMFRPARA